ncbi:MAG TPA: hypothetical protein VFK48_16510 [Usitatibacter sp.]|nr:hypothetical protein [Usitatibacter sp.]
MAIEKIWYFALAVAAGVAGGKAARVWSSRGSRDHAARREHSADVKSWENEGGNLAPAPK